AEERALESLSEGAVQVRCPARHRVIGSRRGDRGEHGQAERPADLLRGVDEPARQALLSLLDSGHGRDRRGDKAEAEANCREQRGTEDVGEEAAADGYLAEPGEPERDGEQPRRKDRLEAEARDELTAAAGRDE